MSTAQLVLSLFPGIGMLDMAFEEVGFVVVRGPDLLWGGDIRRFHPPAGRFDGVIGGPPCQRFSPLANIVRAVHGEDSVAPDLIPEFERVVHEAHPAWFVMENVPKAPVPDVIGYTTRSELLRDVEVGGETSRVRRFTFGSYGGALNFWLETLPLWRQDPEPAVTSDSRAVLVAIGGSGKRKGTLPTVTGSSGGRRKVAVRDKNGRVRGNQGDADEFRLSWRSVGDMARLQGVPEGFVEAMQEDGAFTSRALRKMIGNGVPLPMGRAVAKAVLAAISTEGRM